MENNRWGKVADILIDFLCDNIRKFFWGTLVLLVCWLLWSMDLHDESKTIIIGLAGFAMSQLKLNVPQSEGKNGNNTVPPVSGPT